MRFYKELRCRRRDFKMSGFEMAFLKYIVVGLDTCQEACDHGGILTRPLPLSIPFFIDGFRSVRKKSILAIEFFHHPRTVFNVPKKSS